MFVFQFFILLGPILLGQIVGASCAWAGGGLIAPIESSLSRIFVQKTAPAATLPPPSPVIRVRIGEQLGAFNVRGFDLKFDGPSPRRVPASDTDRSSEWEIQCRSDSVVLTRSESASSKRVQHEMRSPMTVESPSGFLSFNGRPYREKLRIYAQGKRCEVVNHVDLERYLDGLVNAEFSASWAEEAVAAQVIAARTYGVFQAKHRARGSHYDVDSTTRDQVYDGSFREDYRASRVVERTRGWVIATRGNALKAYYHSTCGGSTELPERVWGEKSAGFKRRVSCPYCASSPRFQWEHRLSSADVARAVRDDPAKWPAHWSRAAKDALSKGKVEDLRVSRRDAQGRAHVVTLGVRLGKALLKLELSGANLRSILGFTKIRSTLFDVSAEVAHGARSVVAWTFKGRGNGHGVGLCQWGAKVMAEQGKSHQDILKHYYPDAKLARLW